MSIISEVLGTAYKIFEIVRRVIKEGSYRFILGAKEGIDMNDHHVFAKAIAKTLGKDHYLLKEIDLDYTINIPSRLHFNYNYMFAGDFLHTEVLGKLDQILSKDFCVYNEAINQTVEFFFYVHVFKYKKINLRIPFREIGNLAVPIWRIKASVILDFFEIDRSDVVRYLEEFFFHQEYKK